jgi:hypothetical protein
MRYPDVPVGPRLEALLALAYRARRPVLLEGVTGVGKSEVVRAVAARLGIASTVLDLSLLEPPDLVGLPVVEAGRTTYATPRALPTDGAGILMLEELNRAERYIQQPALQLLTARKLHEYTLPPDWVCFAAINPESGDYHVTPLDRALRARFLHVRVRADRASWLAWALTNDVHPGVVALARAHERIFEDIPPRSWVYASHLLKTLTSAELRDDTLLRDALGGYLPPSWCELLLSARDGWGGELGVDVRAVLASYKPDVAQAVRKLRDEGKTDRLAELALRVQGIVEGPEVSVLAAEKAFSLTAFEAFVADLPGDIRERLQAALGKNPTASPLIELAPDAALRSVSGSGAADRLRSWMADPQKHHRVMLFVTALRLHLEQSGRAAEVRKSNAIRTALGQLLAILGQRFGMPLVDKLLELGITPIKPA